MLDTITVLDNGHPVTFTFDAINSYHGGGFPGGFPPGGFPGMPR